MKNCNDLFTETTETAKILERSFNRMKQHSENLNANQIEKKIDTSENKDVLAGIIPLICALKYLIEDTDLATILTAGNSFGSLL